MLALLDCKSITCRDVSNQAIKEFRELSDIDHLLRVAHSRLVQSLLREKLLKWI